MEQEERLQEMTVPLLAWYQEHARVLPWRTEPAPYRVWVSEIMLQQTRVAAVIGYFERFMSALPTVSDLAQVSEDELMKLWQGLGYYNRARNLQKAARQIMEEYGGVFPASYADIHGLAGVGDYTAGAVASIAFGVPVPAVDGNVLRVVSRILGDERDISLQSTKDAVRDLLLKVIPKEFPGNFNQALMELGATVCLPNGAPQCEHCPVCAYCVAQAEQRTEDLPRKTPKKGRKLERRTVYLVFHQGKVALRKRAPKGLLAGLWEYPNAEAQIADPMIDWKLSGVELERGLRGKHIFSHIEWHMEAVVVETDTEVLPEGWVWAGKRELDQIYAVPNAFRFAQPLVERYLEKWEGLP